MGGIYTALHANIQDVFAEKGIQIMTPNYRADPEVPKIRRRRTAGWAQARSDRE